MAVVPLANIKHTIVERTKGFASDAGSHDHGLHSRTCLATWPTAAAALMKLPPLHAMPALPVSPASTGSLGSFSNKRRSLETPLSPASPKKPRRSGTAWQGSADASQQLRLHLAKTRNSSADLESDAESDPLTGAPARLQHCASNPKFWPATVGGLPDFTEQQVPMAIPDLLASPEQLNTDGGDSMDGEHVSVCAHDSPERSDHSSDGMPFQPLDYKGKALKPPGPLPPEQESKLDHTKVGSWVWWRPDDIWWFAKVR